MKIIDYIYIHTFEEENNIILNSLTGAIDIVNKNVALALKNKDIEAIKKENDEILILLKKRGYIVESDLELQNLISETYNKYLKYIDYNVFLILPTYTCNLACPYCFEEDLTYENVRLTDSKIENIFNCIKRCSEESNKMSIVQLFGGEPLLKNNIDIVEKVLYKCKENNIKAVDVVTT